MLAPVPTAVWPLRPSEADIANATSLRELDDGRRYVRQNRVSDLERSEDGSEVTARTRGSRPQPYRQKIGLKRDASGALEISGWCSCPVGYNCKHVAAVLVAARERWRHGGHIVEPKLSKTEPPARLTPELLGWLSDLEQAAKDNTDEYPDEVRHRLFYVLRTEPRPGRTSVLAIDLLSAAQLKNGGLGRPAMFALHSSKSDSLRFLRPVDRRLIEKLSKQVWDEGLIPAILATGRARLGGLEGPALREGPQRPGRIEAQRARRRANPGDRGRGGSHRGDDTDAAATVANFLVHRRGGEFGRQGLA